MTRMLINMKNVGRFRTYRTNLCAVRVCMYTLYVSTIVGCVLLFHYGHFFLFFVDTILSCPNSRRRRCCRYVFNFQRCCIAIALALFCLVWFGLVFFLLSCVQQLKFNCGSVFLCCLCLNWCWTINWAMNCVLSVCIALWCCTTFAILYGCWPCLWLQFAFKVARKWSNRINSNVWRVGFWWRKKYTSFVMHDNEAHLNEFICLLESCRVNFVDRFVCLL